MKRDKSELKKEIDKLRKELYELMENEDVSSEMVADVSIRLDELILEYQYMKAIVYDPEL